MRRFQDSYCPKDVALTNHVIDRKSLDVVNNECNTGLEHRSTLQFELGDRHLEKTSLTVFYGI